LFGWQKLRLNRRFPNNNDTVTVAQDGNFSFATQVAGGSAYNVTVLTQPAGQSCTITGGGSGTIGAANVTITITCAIASYTIGGTVTGLNGSMVLHNGGDNLTSVNGPFTFPTAVAYGNTYSVTLLSLQFPNQTCTLTGGNGTATANVTTVAVNCVKNTTPRFAYVANYGDGISPSTVSAYTINASTGALTSIATAVAAGIGPHSVTVDPSGKFAYVANWSSNDVSAYTINASGALIPVGTVATATNPFSVTVDPTFKFAYVANYGDGISPSTVSAYTIDSTGALTSIATAVAAGIAPSSVTVDPTGKFAYVVNQGSNNVSAYTINASGALTSIGTVATGTNPVSVSVDPSGKFAYVANWGTNDVSQYKIGSDGSLAAMTPATVAAGTTPASVTVDPSGKYAYVANQGSNDVSAYTINASGALTPIICSGTSCRGNNFPAGTNPISVTVDPSGKFAYVANYGDDINPSTVSAYNINASSGALTAVGGSPFLAGVGPVSVTTTGTTQ
jgi:6-phosphogluconolactonase (cycloisomerase 2 family)